jgi:hypothetical protein
MGGTGLTGDLMWANTAVTDGIGQQGWYVYNGTGANGWGNIDVCNKSPSVEKIFAEVKRKQFLQPRHEILIPKAPELQLVDPGAIHESAPVEIASSKVDYDILKPIGTHRDQKVYEVYEVPERPWSADQQHWDESIESRGLRKTSMGFYIMDDAVKFGFRRRKILELRQPPAFVSGRTRLSDKKLSGPETIARQLLRRYVGDKEFKRYLKFGYIMMSAHGYTWKVPGERSTVYRVIQYQKEKAINAYCVHFSDTNIPPTDACVMRMALIWAGIDVLKKHSNVGPADSWSTGTYGAPVKQDKGLTMLEAIKKVKADYNLVGNVL